MSSAITTVHDDDLQPGCLDFVDVFQHPLIEEPPSASAPADVRRQHIMLSRKAANLCQQCPLMQTCLFDAVVRFDVAGFAGGTTARQRSEMRSRLGITVESEDLDTLAGITARHRQVDHDEVVRLRSANPHESLETLAHRLGCSLSTVKRHLRKHRNQERPVSARLRKPQPTLAQVLTVFRQVVTPGTARSAA